MQSKRYTPKDTSYSSFGDELTLEDSMVLKGGRIIVYRNRKIEIPTKVHASHQSIKKNMHLLVMY